MEDMGDELKELREPLKELYDFKLWLAQKRQINPEDENLEKLWVKMKETALPLYTRYMELRKPQKEVEDLIKTHRAILQRIGENPQVIARLAAENQAIKIQREEARSYEQLMMDRFTQLGYCYRWTDSKGGKHIEEVRFSEVHMTLDAVYFKIAASHRTMFGAWKTKLPYGVRVADLVKEETLIELSFACQRQISCRANSKNGAWIIVNRLDTNDGLLNQVKYADVMRRYPKKHHIRIPLCVGVAMHRQVQWLNLVDYPHMLIAGFTGSGKSNFVNSIICTLITMHSPEEVRLLLVDLKDGVEFSSYEQIPHLHGQVVDKISVLADKLNELEAIMQERNQLMRGKAKTLTEYQVKFPQPKIPRIICIIDEVASIMSHGELTKRINVSLRELTAKGRAPGIHILLSTQRPSVDAIDGGIKVNLAARIVGRMPSHTDSLTVLGTGEAKELAAVPGRMIMQIGPDPIPIQTPLIEEADIVTALQRAMEYEKPEKLNVPDNANLIEEWSPEKIIALSLNFLGGNISHTAVWNEVRDEGRLTFKQNREICESIWKMDCIDFEGKQYHVERGKGRIKKLVEIVQSDDLMNPA